jgi:hypothetical protein
MRSWKRRFEAMVEGLRKNPAIEVTEYRTKPPTAARSLAKLGKTEKIDDRILRFYSEIGRLKLTWIRKGGNPDGRISGSIYLMPIERVLTWYTLGGEQLENLRPFDFPETEAEDCAAFQMDGSSCLPVVYCTNDRNQTEDMGLDFEGYLEALLQTRGYLGWQRARVAAPGDEFATSVREAIAGLFPEVDLRKLFPRRKRL